VYRDGKASLNFETSDKLTSSVWHSDVTYEEQPPGLTTLFLFDSPPSGGDTAYASQVGQSLVVVELELTLLQKLTSVCHRPSARTWKPSMSFTPVSSKPSTLDEERGVEPLSENRLRMCIPLCAVTLSPVRRLCSSTSSSHGGSWD
jgi:hypothetical protein